MTNTPGIIRACVLAVLASFCSLHLHAEEPEAADVKTFDKVIRPLFQKHCVRCHGADKPKAGLRVDRLGADMFKEKSGAVWHEIADRVNLGAMPPKNEPALSRDELTRLSNWIAREQQRSTAQARRGGALRDLIERWSSGRACWGQGRCTDENHLDRCLPSRPPAARGVLQMVWRKIGPGFRFNDCSR